MHRTTALLSTAFQSLRQHPLRAILSTLGLVIGVAALVAILSLADGLERFAREQIATTTDLQLITVAPITTERIDGVTIRRDAFPVPTPDDAEALAAHLGAAATPVLMQQRSVEIESDTVRSAAALVAAGDAVWAAFPFELAAGRTFTTAEAAMGARVVVLSAPLAERLAGAAPPETLIGRQITLAGVEAEVVGVVTAESSPEATAVGPFAAFAAETDTRPPALYVHVTHAEDVVAVTERTRRWLDERFDAGTDAFTVATDANRTEQLRRSMLLFKVIMGLITGISVVVGGVGVMNVLLITVTERTREIGVRKAAGARRGDIVLQFLAEAVAVSSVGSVLGLVVGAVGIVAVTPVIRHLTDAPFMPAFTASTLLIVAALAAGVGIAFGTYPALRAARLRPADAIRHE
jgi:putative ABC transport system permease protein